MTKLHKDRSKFKDYNASVTHHSHRASYHLSLCIKPQAKVPLSQSLLLKVVIIN